MSTAGTAAPARVTVRSLFANGEYRALWLAQLVSIAGDQFARVALSVLVFDRTRSAVLAAVTLAISAGAGFAGGLLLGWVADQLPRRTVMIVSDVACLALVAVMTVPGMPVAALIVLLFAATMAVQPYSAARSATNKEALKDRFALGNALTVSTYEVAQFGGFAAGGVIAGLAGPRLALGIDAGSFAVSAVLVWSGVKARPAAAGERKPRLWTGVRLVFGEPTARTALLLICLATFFGAPEGIAVPLARQFGGGAQAAGWLLAATTAGAAAGPVLYVRFVPEGWRTRLTAVMPLAACALLTAFALPVTMAAAVVILAASGLCVGYIADAAAALIGAMPDAHRGKVSGTIGASLFLGQGAGMVAAGAVAEAIRPSLAVAACGATGTAIAVLLAVAWRHQHTA